jgi:hypothetical protein
MKWISKLTQFKIVNKKARLSGQAEHDASPFFSAWTVPAVVTTAYSISGIVEERVEALSEYAIQKPGVVLVCCSLAYIGIWLGSGCRW